MSGGASSRGAADASAIGTTVLRIKEIPPRPAELDGCVHVGGLPDAGWDGAALCARFERWGPATAEHVTGGSARLRFGSHAAAEAAVRGHKAVLGGLGDSVFACLAYNETPYDDEGKGRGWCRLESAVSSEGISRAAFMPELASVLQALPPKVRPGPKCETSEEARTRARAEEARLLLRLPTGGWGRWRR